VGAGEGGEGGREGGGLLVTLALVSRLCWAVGTLFFRVRAEKEKE